MEIEIKGLAMGLAWLKEQIEVKAFVRSYKYCKLRKLVKCKRFRHDEGIH